MSIERVSTARRFGVTDSTVCSIRLKKTWTHINVPAAYYEVKR